MNTDNPTSPGQGSDERAVKHADKHADERVDECVDERANERTGAGTDTGRAVPPGSGSRERLDARFEAAFAALPLVAILRGLTPAEAVPAGRALYEAGFRLIEVPLNSPEPFESIARLRQALPMHALVGAGTVMHADQVARLSAIDAELVVMPHADIAVIAAAKAHGRLCVPGVATPTEAFAALAAGADALKLFPAELVTPRVIKALRAVLPPTVRLLPVGGITTESMAEHVAAGANGFGLGSALYTPGVHVNELARRAQAFVTTWRALPPR